MTILDIKDLNVSFNVGDERLNVIRGLNLSLDKGCSVSMVGESGSGKSVIASAILRALERNAILTGDVIYRGQSIYKMPENALRSLRGKHLGMIPQNAFQAWDPLMKVGKQMVDFMEKTGAERGRIPEIVHSSLERCGFDDPEAVMNSYPHRLSGGMSQRAMIAMCIAPRPDLLIADEPTKGVDGASMRKIVDILSDLGEESTRIVITHDLSIARCCEHTAVLYGGVIVEYGPSEDVLNDPLHHYTKGLRMAQPKNGMCPIPGGGKREFGEGCPFMNRCPMATSECARCKELKRMGDRLVRCIHV